LIDEARTPLVISKDIHGSDSTQLVYRQALLLARQLKQGEDYQIVSRTKEIIFTDKGVLEIEKYSKAMGPIWKGKLRREELVHQALSALHLFFRDRHYLVRDGKIHIIDGQTGRLMSDRSWGRGLHQMVETKEGCELTGHKETLARLTYQRFYRRYLHLSGMTGTAKEVSGELKAVYDLKVVPIPTRKPVQRRWLGLSLYKDVRSKWLAIITRVRELHMQGRPVLVGTRSVQESEYISQFLTKLKLPHHVLNARQDQNEAAIVAEGGQRGCITVATNMAGRGTDIPLHDGVANIGGLHVIATEYNEARRIDRQLFGRCARQGDPGSCEAIVSLEDDLLKDHCHGLLRYWLEKRIDTKKPAKGIVARMALILSQWQIEKMHRKMRRAVLKMEEKMDEMLAFSGRPE
ncbi:MAG: prepilin peptidase, partial [Gammaproteobacteria bacterium]|nr:prepilin peptidase [Gammaproteobacteria bacterium]